MKNKILRAITGLILFLMPNVGFGQAPVLGHAAGFVLFTTNGAMTCSGTKYLTHLTGDVGSNLAGSVTGFGNVDGTMHAFDVASGQCTPDVISLYTQLSTAIPTATLATPFGSGTTLFAGVYHLIGASTLTSTLILDGQGDPNAVFIFQIGGLFSTNASSKIKLINGALACNVFWQVGGAVNVGTGTYLRGTIVANGQIDMTSTLDTLEGRALALNAAVLVSQLVAYTPIGCGSPYLTGPAAPPMLDSTAAYGVFSSIGAVTSTPVTYVIGSVGANSTAPTGFNPLNVTGAIHAMDPSTAAAAADLTNIYNYLVALPADIDLLDPSDFGHDLVLTPHSYQITGITPLTGNLYLNAEGNPNAVFVIKINGAVTSSTLSHIMLINGTQAKNVYWKIDGAVDIFSNSVFNGTMVAAGAISLETGDTLNGRALTINGAVAINGSYVKITPRACTAPVIGGVMHACVGSTSTLTDSTLGGKWTSADTTIATIDSNSGMATGIRSGNASITYTTSAGCTNSASFTVNGAPSAITGPGNVCVGSSITLIDTTIGGTWSSSNTLLATVGSLSGIVSGVAAGTPVITYTVPTGCIATKAITVNATGSAGIITGPSNVCVGSTITLADTVAGGVWSSSNIATATVVAGVVTGVSTGIDTIKYTVTTTCGTATATQVITVGTVSSAGVITGLSAVCVGSTITLSDIVSGGTWSSSNTSATVGSTGIVSGVSPGIDTIIYSIASGCGTATTTKNITINPLPNAGSISGPSSVCVGSSIALTDGAPGGIWSSSNTSATVVGGLVTGITAGNDTISYSVTNTCGTAAATKIIAVNSLPNAGIITGASTVCVGSSITLNDGVSGGTWSSSNTSATVAGGIVTGVSAGIDTISYSVTSTCGTAATSKTITVNPLPNAGSISGPSSVCVGSSIILTDGMPGGTWSSSNANATVSGGLVTGVSAGSNVISYTVINTCGSASATHAVVVMPLANAGTISGPSSVCVGSAIALTDGVPGGAWSSSNFTAAIGTSGVVTGVTAGLDTIVYTYTNACGTDATTHLVTVNPLPNAGSIAGPSTVCVASSITLTDGVAGGSWSSSNTSLATANTVSGVITGIAAGVPVIMYTVTNMCGAATATHAITVNPLPFAGSITGASSVCVASSTTLTDPVTGGTWSSSNANATVAGGIVTGISAGAVAISYSVTNMCGTISATKALTVNPLPNAGTIIGASSVCVGVTITLTDGAAGGTWSSSNTSATVAGGVVTGVIPGTDTIGYTVTNMCGTTAATKQIIVNAQPDAGTITGASAVCAGSSITLSDIAPGGTWSGSNTVASVGTTGVVTGVSAGSAITNYTVINVCGTAMATKTILVNPLPLAPVITTQAPSTACTGTMFQNFGTSNPPQVGTTYSWTAINAIVWAQGTAHQYALINFTKTGTAYITLNATFAVSGCTNKTTTAAVTVGATEAQIATVSYFNNHFVCTPADEDSYQWGYDDAYTLDSTILPGEINQDYINVNPDLKNKKYWAMTTLGGCLQKTYYQVPTNVQNVNSDAGISVYPNPAASIINVVISSSVQGQVQLEILNMLGQRMTSIATTDNKATIDVAGLPAGSYLVICYNDGIKIATARFIKN